MSKIKGILEIDNQSTSIPNIQNIQMLHQKKTEFQGQCQGATQSTLGGYSGPYAPEIMKLANNTCLYTLYLQSGLLDNMMRQYGSNYGMKRKRALLNQKRDLLMKMRKLLTKGDAQNAMMMNQAIASIHI